MNRWQKLAMMGFAGLLLLAFWAGLWYQSERLAPATELSSNEAETKQEINEDVFSQEAILAGEVKNEAEKEREYVKQEKEETLAVHVVGQVAAAGVYYLAPGSRIYDAVVLAQPLEDANLDILNLALPVEDGMQIRVPKYGDSLGWHDGQLIIYPDIDKTVAKESQGRINLNTAGQEQLESLPGIGPVYAKRIIEYRSQHGNFKKVEDLLQVKGIGQSTLNKIRDLVVCS